MTPRAGVLLVSRHLVIQTSFLHFRYKLYLTFSENTQQSITLQQFQPSIALSLSEESLLKWFHQFSQNRIMELIIPAVEFARPKGAASEDSRRSGVSKLER